MLQGPATNLYKKMTDNLDGLKLIASGGIAGMQDLFDLKAVGCDGAIIGKAIYEGNIQLKELEQFILNNHAD